MSDGVTPSNKELGPVARRLAATQRVLCVEDEADIAAFLRAYFRAAGYDLVHIDPSSTDEVLAALEEHDPDLMLLDLRLRGFSGGDAYRRIRSDDRYAFLPVIMVSADASADPAVTQPRGLDAFVAKPFNTNSLAAMVAERIERARELAQVGTHDTLPLLTQDYLLARLADEIAVAGDGGTFAFGIIDLRSTHDIVAEVGDEGLEFLIGSLVERARAGLPDEVVFGRTDREELAVVLPGLGPRDAYATLRRALTEISGEFTFAGGAVVPVSLAGGLATYPANATDPDGLFMAADSALADAVEDDALLELAL